MSLTKMTQKQMTLAQTAHSNPQHRFTNLYSLLHWDYWIRCAADKVLARPGSATAGVDGTTRDYFQKTYEDQIQGLVESLKRKTYAPSPVRRTYIPKGNGKKRPLGIQTVHDRIVQEAVRAILDPIYESDFAHYSYGFRKGRCTMDAIAAIMPRLNGSVKYYYIIEGDIKSYFDEVHHRKLISLLKRRIEDKALLSLLWQFLKAGVMEDGLFARTDKGVSQGGVVSPLLANVYLHELDQWAAKRWDVDRNHQQRNRYAGRGNAVLIRYADDFVILSNGPIAEVREIKEEVKQFLSTTLHLELSEEKTRLTHANDGFTFLGYHIQRVRPEDRWVVHVRPTPAAKERVKRKIKSLTARGWTWMDEYTRLTTLNALTRGWAEYYKYTSLLRDIEDITRYVWFRYLQWLRRKHKGSRKQHLITTKTKIVHGRTRWYATITEADKTLEAWQWLPTRKELARRRYPQRGKGQWQHPYLTATPPDEDYPTGNTGPDERLYTQRIGARSRKRCEPVGMAEVKLRVKMRDGFRCTQCGRSGTPIQVHHKKGIKSHRKADLETVCLGCHHRYHHYRHKP
jgi:RNA-directed DNA polymerase